VIMTIEDKNILWLDLFDFLTYSKKVKLLSLLLKDEDIRKVFLTKLEIRQELSDQEFNKMALCLDDMFLSLRLEKYTQDSIIPITINDIRYPYPLKEISSPPLCLYCKGNIQLLKTLCVGVVGTRKPTDYGIQVTKQYVKALVDADITVVSGMAVGVDTLAHKTAIDNNGKTIAVLAGGFNHIYPASNYHLAKTLAENNLLITEQNPDTKPQAYLFPVRNRIIAGLSRGVLTTEMGEKSGSLYTVNYAIEFNRDVFVVPGRINSEMSKGSNALIKSLQGCITTSPDDILDLYNRLGTKVEEKPMIQLDMNSQIVLDYISNEKKTFQEIIDYSGLSARELNGILISPEMDGLVIKLANNSYIRA